MSGSNAIEGRKLILVGKSGSGKSSTGNTILGTQPFKSKPGLNSGTQKCEMHSGTRGKNDGRLSVVDTPGLFDTDRPFAERALEIQKALELCPNPHAFLIIMSYGRYTEEEKLTLTMLRLIFGEEFLKHAILVFTRGTEFSLEELNSEFKENASLDNLQTKCGGRIVKIENNPTVDGSVREEMTRNFFGMVEKVSDGGQKCYQTNSLDVHRKILKNHLKNRKTGETLEEELSQLAEELDRELKSNKKFYGGLAIGAAIGVTVVGAACFLPTMTVNLVKDETVVVKAVKAVAQVVPEAVTETTGFRALLGASALLMAAFRS